MANGDAERIAAGDLSTADATSLKAMLAQIDSLKGAITKILANRAQPTTPGAAAHPATPADTPEKTLSAPDRLSIDGAPRNLNRRPPAHNTTQVHAGGEVARVNDASVMHVD